MSAGEIAKDDDSDGTLKSDSDTEPEEDSDDEKREKTDRKYQPQGWRTSMDAH